LVGGVLKGVLGIGAPLLAVPVLALFFSVPFAVCMFVMPNLVSNAHQLYQYRSSIPKGPIAWLFAAGGGLGALIGSFALDWLPTDFLKLTVAGIVTAYIVARLLKPALTIPPQRAIVLAGPVGTFAGFLQGAAGISAPISVTFLSALHLNRHPFIATIAIFFFALALVQLPTLALIGLLDGPTLLLSGAAIIPLLAGMRLGDAIIQRAKPIWFERAIMSVLVLMAIILVGSIWV